MAQTPQALPSAALARRRSSFSPDNFPTPQRRPSGFRPNNGSLVPPPLPAGGIGGSPAAAGVSVGNLDLPSQQQQRFNSSSFGAVDSGASLNPPPYTPNRDTEHTAVVDHIHHSRRSSLRGGGGGGPMGSRRSSYATPRGALYSQQPPPPSSPPPPHAVAQAIPVVQFGSSRPASRRASAIMRPSTSSSSVHQPPQAIPSSQVSPPSRTRTPGPTVVLYNNSPSPGQQQHQQSSPEETNASRRHFFVPLQTPLGAASSPGSGSNLHTVRRASQISTAGSPEQQQHHHHQQQQQQQATSSSSRRPSYVFRRFSVSQSQEALRRQTSGTPSATTISPSSSSISTAAPQQQQQPTGEQPSMVPPPLHQHLLRKESSPPPRHQRSFSAIPRVEDSSPSLRGRPLPQLPQHHQQHHRQHHHQQPPPPPLPRSVSSQFQPGASQQPVAAEQRRFSTSISGLRAPPLPTSATVLPTTPDHRRGSLGVSSEQQLEETSSTPRTPYQIQRHQRSASIHIRSPPPPPLSPGSPTNQSGVGGVTESPVQTGKAAVAALGGLHAALDYCLQATRELRTDGETASEAVESLLRITNQLQDLLRLVMMHPAAIPPAALPEDDLQEDEEEVLVLGEGEDPSVSSDGEVEEAQDVPLYPPNGLDFPHAVPASPVGSEKRRGGSSTLPSSSSPGVSLLPPVHGKKPKKQSRKSKPQFTEPPMAISSDPEELSKRAVAAAEDITSELREVRKKLEDVMNGLQVKQTMHVAQRQSLRQLASPRGRGHRKSLNLDQHGRRGSLADLKRRRLLQQQQFHHHHQQQHSQQNSPQTPVRPPRKDLDFASGSYPGPSSAPRLPPSVSSHSLSTRGAQTDLGNQPPPPHHHRSQRSMSFSTARGRSASTIGFSSPGGSTAGVSLFSSNSSTPGFPSTPRRSSELRRSFQVDASPVQQYQRSLPLHTSQSGLLSGGLGLEESPFLTTSSSLSGNLHQGGSVSGSRRGSFSSRNRRPSTTGESGSGSGGGGGELPQSISISGLSMIPIQSPVTDMHTVTTGAGAPSAGDLSGGSSEHTTAPSTPRSAVRRMFGGSGAGGGLGAAGGPGWKRNSGSQSQNSSHLEIGGSSAGSVGFFGRGTPSKKGGKNAPEPLFGGRLVEHLKICETQGQVPYILAVCCNYLREHGLELEGLFRVAGSEKMIGDLCSEFDDDYHNRYRRMTTGVQKQGQIGVDLDFYFSAINDLLDDGDLEQLTPTQFVHTVADVLKQYLMNLKDPVFPTSHYDHLVGIYNTFADRKSSSSSGLTNSQAEDGADEGQSGKEEGAEEEEEEKLRSRLEQYRVLMASVPNVHRQVIAYLMRFLKEVADHEEFNHMGAGNLARIWGPSLLRPSSLDTDPLLHMSTSIEVIRDLIEYADRVFLNKLP